MDFSAVQCDDTDQNKLILITVLAHEIKFINSLYGISHSSTTSNAI